MQSLTKSVRDSGIRREMSGLRQKITIGVLHRVEELADREEGFVSENGRHYESLVPLTEVIAASTGKSSGAV